MEYPILYTKNFRDTAALLYTRAKREQIDNERSVSVHADRKPGTLKELQEFIVAAFPNVGNKLAVELLKKFGSIRGSVAANMEELREVELIGEKKAQQIHEVIHRVYNKYE